MNIKDFKAMVANLPNEVTPEQFAMIEQDVESLLAEQRQVDMDSLNQYELMCGKLREKLGLNAPPPARPPHPEPIDEEWGELESRDLESGVSADSFRAEQAALRERTREKRRRL